MVGHIFIIAVHGNVEIHLGILNCFEFDSVMNFYLVLCLFWNLDRASTGPRSPTFNAVSAWGLFI